MPESKPVKAKLYTVSEPLDRPVDELIQGEDSVDVQFNPTSLRVSLSNTLKENESGGNSRAAQYVDKSSSTLTVELIFDTSDYRADDSGGNAIDVRSKTRRIAETFMAPQEGEGEGDQQVPQRCLFQWGSFAFVGIMDKFDETLDFFSPEGTPLRATVSLKLSESRFQFRSKDAQAAQQNTPTLSSPPQDAPVSQAASEAGKDEKDWRDTSLFNGIESPRLPSLSAVAVPKLSAGASLGVSGSFSAGASLSVGASAGLSVGGGGVSASAKLTPPSFRYGASASLGTGISGAFATDSKNAGGLRAGALASGGARLRGGAAVGASASLSGGAKASAGVGFD